MSLDKLTSFLSRDKLKIVCSEFSILSDEEFGLLTRKDVFPYEYVDCVEKLKETELSLHKSVRWQAISESDYVHAANV